MLRNEQNKKHNSAGSTDIETSEQDDIRVMRCFCGCTALTYEEIECFAKMSVSCLVVHKTGKRLFENFLRIGYHNDKSEVLMHLKCFEKCNQFLRNLQIMIHDQDSIQEFTSLCPSFVWEQRFTSSIQTNNLQILQQTLNDLKLECVQNIECNNDYDRFKRELLRKIGKT